VLDLMTESLVRSKVMSPLLSETSRRRTSPVSTDALSIRSEVHFPCNHDGTPACVGERGEEKKGVCARTRVVREGEGGGGGGV